MEAKTDLDVSRKPALMPPQFSTDGCSMDFGTFDKHGFIYVPPPSIGEHCQSAAATQASSLNAQLALIKEGRTAQSGRGADAGRRTDSSEKIAAPPGKGKVQRTPITKDPGESQASSLQDSESSDKIVPAGEGKVQKKPITEDPGESVGDVIGDKLTKRKLDADSPEIITGGFRRAKLMDNLRYLALINKMSNWKRRKERKTSG